MACPQQIELYLHHYMTARDLLNDAKNTVNTELRLSKISGAINEAVQGQREGLPHHQYMQIIYMAMNILKETNDD